MDKHILSVDIGKSIKQYRQKAGLTQEKLAEILGVTFQQVQNYENGKNKLNTDKVQQVCEALSISVSQLFSEQEGNRYLLSAQEEKLIESFRKLTDERKECVLLLAEASSKKKSRTPK